ncbi:hypothetical protein V6Z12_A13G173700 [Gossypium hirsutum]
MVAMKIISWNVRGLKIHEALRRLQQMLKLHNPQVVFFMETKLDSVRMERVRRRGKFVHDIDVLAEGTRGGLSLGWKIDIDLQSYSSIHVDLNIRGPDNCINWRLSWFYGSLIWETVVNLGVSFEA